MYVLFVPLTATDLPLCSLLRETQSPPITSPILLRLRKIDCPVCPQSDHLAAAVSESTPPLRPAYIATRLNTPQSRTLRLAHSEDDRGPQRVSGSERLRSI
jgi:hypothetical protein